MRSAMRRPSIRCSRTLTSSAGCVARSPAGANGEKSDQQSRAGRRRRATAGRCSSPMVRRSRCWLRDCANESSRWRWVSACHWRTRARHSRTSPWARPAVRCCCPETPRSETEGGLMKGIASMADVLAVERLHPPLPNSTYEMIRAAASVHAKAPALSFFLRVQDHERPTTWSYESSSPASPPRPTSSTASASARTMSSPSCCRTFPRLI